MGTLSTVSPTGGAFVVAAAPYTRKKKGRSVGRRKSQAVHEKKWEMGVMQNASCFTHTARCLHVHKERKLHLTNGIPSLQRANKRSVKDMVGMCLKTATYVHSPNKNIVSSNANETLFEAGTIFKLHLRGNQQT